MQRQQNATGFCAICHEGRFALDESLKIPWHRRLKPGVNPLAEHLSGDYERCEGIGKSAVQVSPDPRDNTSGNSIKGESYR